MGQDWKTISNTKIKFSNFIHPNQDNWTHFSFEYFKKGDRIIGVGKNLAQQFYDLFSDSPFAFDDIFEVARFKTELPNRYAPYFDTTILKIPYQTAIIISDLEEIEGHNETTWVLTNITWSGSGINPCFFNISFQKSTGKYLSSRHSHCNF